MVKEAETFDHCFVGQMSGTSADGMDWVAISSTHQCLTHHSFPYTASLKQLIRHTLSNPEDTQPLDQRLTEFCLDSFSRFRQSLAMPIHAVGLHGHTLNHEPAKGISTTLIQPQIIADQTGIPVVGHMRLDDIRAGGQGAPLAPLFHEQIFANSDQNIGVLNLGGMANLTVLEKGKAVLGFDTGPGNTLLDAIARSRLTQAFDDRGQQAAQGYVQSQWLNAMLDDVYFAQSPPKSTGIEYFNVSWLTERFEAYEAYSVQDQLATLSALTTESIHLAIEALPMTLDELIVCGGGAHNDLLIKNLTDQGLKVQISSDYGWPVSTVEGGAWAWLAKMRMERTYHDTRQLTGAKYPLPLGTIFHPNTGL